MPPKIKLNIIIFIVIVGFISSVLFRYTLASCFGLNRYPFNTFLFYAEDRFNGFLNTYNAGRVAIYSLLYPTPFIGLRPAIFEVFVAVYPYLCLLLFALITLFILFKEKTFWKQVLLLIAAMVIFPQVSGGYKLIHFFIPMLLFINTEDRGHKTPDLLYSIFFALLLVPKNYYFFKLYPVIDISIVLNPLIIIIICLMIFKQGLKKKSQAQT